MGADGGTKLKRSDFIKPNSNKLSESQYLNSKFTQNSKYLYCQLSNQPLTPPIVADYKGRMFNKTAVLEMLLSKKSQDDIPENIKEFVDLKVKSFDNQVIECCLTEELIDENFTSRLLYFAECGCLMSNEIFKNNLLILQKTDNDPFNYQLPVDETSLDKILSFKNINSCPNCNTKINPHNLIYINPQGVELVNHLKRIKFLHSLGLSHSLKPLKKKKKKGKGIGKPKK